MPGERRTVWARATSSVLSNASPCRRSYNNVQIGRNAMLTRWSAYWIVLWLYGNAGLCEQAPIGRVALPATRRDISPGKLQVVAGIAVTRRDVLVRRVLADGRAVRVTFGNVREARVLGQARRACGDGLEFLPSCGSEMVRETTECS